MKKWLLLLGLFLLGVSILSACNSQENGTEGASETLANPASIYCQGLGYTEETRENADGQYGVCLFPDGTECDSWDFLAGRCGTEKSYCAQQGYTLESNDTNIGTCVFAEGSSCDEFAYFNEECKP